MEPIEGNMTQPEFDKIHAEITRLQMLNAMGENHIERILELKEQVNFE